MTNSRQKGARGERELASLLKQHGFDARRGQQYCGSNGDADVVGVPNYHLEVKRVEKLNIYNAMEQSQSDAKDGETPVVVHRRDRKPWLVTMAFEDWISLIKENDDALRKL